MNNTEINEENEDMKAESTQSDEETSTVENIKEKPQEEADYREKYYYLAAEMDNLKKRLDRERSQIVKFGSENILKDLVQVVDTFELTLNAIRLDDDEKVKNIVVGLEMVSKQFLDALKGHGLEKIDTNGREFDPNFHEAISKEASEGKKEMEIIKEQQSGYILNGRVLRASKVTVASNK